MSVRGTGPAGAGMPGAGVGEPSQRARLLTLWSWLMIPLLFVSFVVGSTVGLAILGQLDDPGGTEPPGVRLLRAGLLGRLSSLLVLLIGMAPAIVGTILGRKGLRAGGGGAAKAALIVNAAILVCLVGAQVLQQVTA